ncbi:energy-coupling factor transporter transmembrane component T [Rothia aerolata]|uniref:energy-coupling factor transporter transmembrane component T n=1 Tax=Rothia aerolata TaxID=1812262 RepID=UPI00166656D1|nr:energy-coupling factor transporter transmembrane component T [Rothia aerolata]
MTETRARWRDSLHPRTWVVLSLCALVLALMPLSLAARVVLLLAQLTLLVAAGRLRGFLLFVGVGLGPVALMAFLVQAVSFSGQTVLASWQPFAFMTFAVTVEGMTYGAHLALQILNFGTACSLLTLLTTTAGLRYALNSWKVPSRLVFLLVASLNAPAQLIRYIRIEQEAARARGLDDSSWLARLKGNLKIASTLFTLILLDHQVRGRALDYRGIELAGQRVFVRDYPDSGLQRVLRWALPLCCLLVVLLHFGVFRGWF